MCIIVLKTKEVSLPKKEYLRNSFMNNDDGAGLMYVKNGMVQIEKGFMKWEDFETRYDELCDEYNNFENMNLVMHFRIGTQGKNDRHTCHPFPISSKHRYLRKTELETDIGVVHNGIISSYSRGYVGEENESLLSDTQLFIKHCVLPFKSLNRRFYLNQQVMKYLDEICGGKLVFLTNDDTVHTLGTFVKDEDGVLYSNETYSTIYSYYNWGYNGWGKYDKDYDGSRVKTGEEDDYEYLTNPYYDYSFDGEDYAEVSMYINDIPRDFQVSTTEGIVVKSDNDLVYDNYYFGLYKVMTDGKLAILGYVDTITDDKGQAILCA